MSRRPVHLLAAAAAALALVLTGCSSSGGGSGSSSPASTTGSGGGSSAASSGASSGGGTDSLAAAQSAVDALTQTTVKMATPPGAVTPGSHKVAVVAIGLGTPGASDTARIVQEAITKIGWTAPPTYDGKFNPSTVSGYIQTAVSGGAQGLVLVAITPATVSSALQLAEQKKVPVVCVLCGPPASFSQFPGVIGVEASPDKSGQAQADYAIVQTKGKGKIWVYEDREFASTTAMNDSAVAELKAKCPGCEVHIVQMKAGDEQKPGVPILASVLAANPKGKIDYIIAPYDGAAAQFATFLQQRGRTDVKVIGYAALPVFFSQLQAGNPSAAATISIPLPYLSYIAVDQIARKLSNSATWDSNDLGVSIITQANKSQYNANSPWTSPGFDVPSYFAKLWGK